MTITEKLKTVKKQIENAAVKSGRNPEGIKLIAVSKFHPAEAVCEAFESGQVLFGENRVQEAAGKFDEVRKIHPAAELHIIGSLQRNKVKEAVRIASCIHSVDRLELIEEIEKQCDKIDKTIDVLFELHTGEESKSGFENENQISEALEAFTDGRFPHVNPAGFMTMAPFTDDKARIRESFTILRECRNRLQEKFPAFNLSELSMGMSGDFEIAIEEGSTMVRIGTAIFGERDYSKA